ncbi:MAG TPA: CinA family protein [Chloroflexota bacterium]|jgi:nicotinamide-nucleotide amidase|nr:CinA family protein [Chloroflexota bacterium]
MEDPLAREIGARLTAGGQTLAVVETAAGGLISAALLALPGASAWFLGGAVVYSAQAKASWLGLPAEAFAPHGVVSSHGATLLASAARRALGATWGLAEVGIAGPQGGRRSSKPAGMVHLAVAGPCAAERLVQTGLDDRGANQAAFARAALTLLAETLAAR